MDGQLSLLSWVRAGQVDRERTVLPLYQQAPGHSWLQERLLLPAQLRERSSSEPPVGELLLALLLPMLL